MYPESRSLITWSLPPALLSFANLQAPQFNVITYNGLLYSISTQSNITYSFKANANYYEVVFFQNSPNTTTVQFQASMQQPKTLYPLSWLTEPAKILFLISAAFAILLTSKNSNIQFSKIKQSPVKMPSISKRNRQYLLAVLLISLVCWLVLLAINTNPLATFENWYTDNARDTYVFKFVS